MKDIKQIIEDATEERENLIQEVAGLGLVVGKLKDDRASMLQESDFNGDSLEVMKLNEKLHNVRRVLSAYNKRREHLDFLLSYIGAEGA